MTKVLFMIPNLGRGGAEKVLVNLVNNMDLTKFDVTVMTLYDEGINKQSLKETIIYKSFLKRSFPGIGHFLKLFSPQFLYKNIVKEHYDIVVSYLEGQTARIVSGCLDETTKKICWIHRTMTTKKDAARLFRSEKEAMKCYAAFDKIVSVSKDVENAFMSLFPLEQKGVVLYNTNDSVKIQKQSKEYIEENLFSQNEFKICAMGSLIPVKGFERLIHVHSELKKEFSVHTYILGEGVEKHSLMSLAEKLEVSESVTFLGYQENPYKYIARCDLFVCSSYSEGFSTAVTEALILGTPVITTKVSGMCELLGRNNEYGIIAENNEEALFQGIKCLLSDPEVLKIYRNKAEERGKNFNSASTVRAAEELFYLLMNSCQ